MSAISVPCSAPRSHCLAARPSRSTPPATGNCAPATRIGLEPRRYRIFAGSLSRRRRGRIFLKIHLSATVGMQQRPLIRGLLHARCGRNSHCFASRRLCRQRSAGPAAVHVCRYVGPGLQARCAGGRDHDLAVPPEQRRSAPSSIDPDLMRLAESQSNAMAAANKMDHDVRAPLAKRLAAGGYPATVAVENISAGYHTLAEAFSGWRDSPPTAPTCSRAVSQNWASRRAMLPAPNTRCSGP